MNSNVNFLNPVLLFFSYMPISQLTKKEKMVFFNLVKNPEMNDSELSKTIAIKRSTVTAIRNRLKKDGFYSTLVVPNLPALGCRLLGITYGKYNPLTPQAERMKAKTFGEGYKHPELVFLRSTDTEFLKLYVGEHLADIRILQDRNYIDYDSHNFIEEINSIYYPFEMGQITSLFNYVPLVGNLFGIELQDVDYNNYRFNGSKETDFTNVEKAILDAIVKNPDANIVELSKLTGKTRTTISKIRGDLIERNIMQNFCLPTLDKLGCELMVFLHTKFNPKSSMEARKEDMKVIMKMANHVFKISGDIESAGIIIPKNYTEFTALYNQMISLYREKNYISENPHALILPVEKLRSKKLDFSALTHKMLFER